MDPDVIRSIKQAALDLDRTASDIMEVVRKPCSMRRRNSYTNGLRS
jgi:hypothetical protein